MTPSGTRHLYLIILTLVALPSMAAWQRKAQAPDYDHSPKGTYLILDSRAESPDEKQHHIFIARREHPTTLYRLYSYPRFADLYFSSNEKYLVITDRSGSNWTECVLLRHAEKPPFFAKPHVIDEDCWKLFWSLHKKPKAGITYDHRYTYLCAWLDASHFVVGLVGDKQIGSGRFSLEGGWHCIYDARRLRAYTDRRTDSINTSYKIELY